MTARSVPVALALVIVLSSPSAGQQNDGRAFSTPENAARALNTATRAEGMDALLAIFGSAGRELFDSSDPATARRNRETFSVAFGEEWRLEDRGTGRKELVIGHESWPFPVPLVKTARGWIFDVAAGKQE